MPSEVLMHSEGLGALYWRPLLKASQELSGPQAPEVCLPCLALPYLAGWRVVALLCLAECWVVALICLALPYLAGCQVVAHTPRQLNRPVPLRPSPPPKE